MNQSHLNNWDDFEVLHSKSPVLDANSFYESYITFKKLVDKLPKQELIKRGWLSSKDDLVSLMPLLQEIHFHKENALFKKSDTFNVALCALWQSRVSTIAKIAVIHHGIDRFQGLDADFLKKIAKLSVDVSSVLSLPKILAEKGIILVYEKYLPKMKLDGVVFTLESGHPVIGISFRFPRLDHFWFTLMHELAHINLHMKFLYEPIFDDLEEINEEVEEVKASRLAKESFVERYLWRNCPGKYDRNNQAIIEFAHMIGIHPAIVAGMLQKELNEYRIFRDIVDQVNIREEVFGED